MEADVIAAIANAGGQAVLLFILSQVWAELKVSNQYMRDQIAKQHQADQERRELREQIESLQAYRAASESRRRGGASDNVN